MDESNRESNRTDKARRAFLSVWTVVGAILLTGILIYLVNILSCLLYTSPSPRDCS